MRRIAALVIFLALASARAGENETTRFLGAEADWGLARLELRALGMAGGDHIAHCASGSACVRLMTGPDERRWIFTLEKKDALALVKLAAEQDLLAVKPKERQAKPDEARSTLVLENALGQTRELHFWFDDPDARLKKVQDALRALEKRTETLDPVFRGKTEPFFRPFAGVQVTIALYSGRPDPSFELVRQEDWEKLRALLKDLSPAERPSDKDAPSLGYRGFLLTPRGLDGVPRWISVHKGTIQLGDSPRDRVYKKDEKGLEAWLEAEAKKRSIEIKK